MEEKVMEIIASQMGIDESEINLNSRLTEDLGADSLDVYQIIAEFEDAFDMQFSNEDTESIKTIKDVVEYIKNAKK